MVQKLTRRQTIQGGLGLAAMGALGRPAIAQTGKIQIGMITHFSGFAQSFGAAMRHGAEIAVDRINGAGGINGQQIEVIFRDDKASTDAAVGAYRDLVASGVKLFIGGPISGPAVAVGPLCKDTDTLFIGAGPSNLSLTHEGYNPNVFRLSHSTIAFNGGIGPVVAKENPDVRKWVAIAQDAQATIDIANATLSSVKKAFQDQHNVTIEIGEMLTTKGGAGDFRAQLSRLANGDAQGMAVSLSGSDTVTLYKQARAFGLEQKIKVFLDNGQELQLAKTLGNQMPAYLWSPTAWYVGSDPSNPVSQAVYKEYVKRTNDKYPFGYTGSGHDSVLVYAEAIKAAKSLDTAAIRTAMENGSPQGALGKLEFRKEDHALLNYCTYLNIVNDPKSEDGFKVAKVLTLPAKDLLEPPSPGQKYVIQ